MVSEYDLLSSEVLADPYPTYHEIRSTDPVYNIGWAWLLTRYSDVMAALRDPRLSSAGSDFDTHELPPEQQERLKPLLGTLADMMLFSDPPKHTRLRALVNKAFTPRVVEGMKAHVQETVDHLLDAVQNAGQMDAIRDLALPLPLTTIAELLGLPVADRDAFKTWCDEIINFFGAGAGVADFGEQADIALQSVLDLERYFHGIIEEHRREPRNDLLSGLIAAEEQGDVLTEHEMLGTCVVTLFAGNETTINLIGNGLLALLRNPDQLQLLKDDPSLIGTAIEEFMRYDSPVQMLQRMAAEDMEIGGKQIAKGERVMPMLAAANRDPAQFPDPDRLDITRKENRHAGFGGGIHFCLGAALGRIEGQIAFNTLLRRMPNLRLASETLEWNVNPTFRGLQALPIIF